MKIWVDSSMAAPDDTYIHCKTVNSAIAAIKEADAQKKDIQIIDLGPIQGEELNDGGERLNVLYWLQENWRSHTVKFHSHRDYKT